MSVRLLAVAAGPVFYQTPLYQALASLEGVASAATV